MRQLFSVLMLMALMMAQAGALACPSAHHETDAVAHETHDGAHQQDPEPAGHGDAEHCTMMSSCGPVTPVARFTQGVRSVTSSIAQPALVPADYTAPTLTLNTPPPRFT